MMAIRSATLVETIAARGEAGASFMARAVAVLFFAALTAAAAQISVPLPFTAVPFTFQPTVVLLSGLVLGPKLGAASQVLYLAAGVAGLPVFAASATLPPGAWRLLGHCRILLSYPLAAFVAGALARRGFDRRSHVDPRHGPPGLSSSTRAARSGATGQFAHRGRPLGAIAAGVAVRHRRPVKLRGRGRPRDGALVTACIASSRFWFGSFRPGRTKASTDQPGHRPGPPRHIERPVQALRGHQAISRPLPPGVYG
jgi:hypothetical protein